MNQYFKKELIVNTFVSSKGIPVQFESVGNNRGVIVLDDEKPEEAALIADLNLAAEKHRGGIVKLNAPQAEELKKNSPHSRSSKPSGQKERLKIYPTVLHSSADRKNAKAAEPSAAPAAEPRKKEPVPPPTGFVPAAMRVKAATETG